MKKKYLFLFFIIIFPQAYLVEVYVLNIGNGSLLSNLLIALVFTFLPINGLNAYAKKYPVKDTNN